MKKLTVAMVIAIAASATLAGAFTSPSAATFLGLNAGNNDLKTNAVSETNSMVARDGDFWKGHVTLMVMDQFGNMKEYREFDNNIVDSAHGHDCVANLVFGSTLNGCTAPGVFNSIGISNCDGADSTANRNDASATTCLAHTTNTLIGMDNVNSEGPGSGVTGDVCGAHTVQAEPATNTVRMERTFAGTDSGFESPVREAAIFTGCTSAAKMFAIQSFADVNVGASDSITVRWDITLSDPGT